MAECGALRVIFRCCFFLTNMKKLILTLLLSGVVLSSTGCYYIAPKRCVAGNVNMTERVNSGESSHYRVYMDNGEVFQNVDALEIGKFNSSTLQSQLNQAYQNKEKVSVGVYGWRIPWLSMFENVKSIGCQND